MWDEIARAIDGLQGRAPGRLLEQITQLLDRSTDVAILALDTMPLALVALVVGLLVWRLRGFAAGVVSTATIGLLGLSRLFPLTLETVAVALVASVVAGLVGSFLATAIVRVRRNLKVDVAPGTGAGIALGATVALLPLAEPLAGRGVDPAWVLTVGLIAGVLVTPAFVRIPPRPGSRHVIAVLVAAIAVSLVGGLVGGWGLGGAIGRALAGSDIPAVLDAGSSALLLLLLLGTFSTDIRRDRAGDEVQALNDPSASDEDSASVVDEEVAR